MFIRQEGRQVRALAPAKLNLFLEILNKRPDGFHEIETLMVAINRFDALSFEPSALPEIELTVRAIPPIASDTLPADPQKNLVYRALKLLQQRSGCEQGGTAILTKRIPPASGLGGGSSDAAAALAAANIAWKLDWNTEQLQSVAAELGSDIPFFLSPRTGNSATMAICRGRGEIVEPAIAPSNMHFVVARPDFGLSTPQVYGMCAPAQQPQDADRLIQCLRSGDRSTARGKMINRLQPAAETVNPTVREIADQFEALHPIAHQLSGSGSAYFGWFASAASAMRAAAKIRGKAAIHAWHAHAI